MGLTSERARAMNERPRMTQQEQEQMVNLFVEDESRAEAASLSQGWTGKTGPVESVLWSRQSNDSSRGVRRS